LRQLVETQAIGGIIRSAKPFAHNSNIDYYDEYVNKQLRRTGSMMPISARGRYSVRMMVFLASRPVGERTTKQDIAEAEDISPAYVVQLMMMLRASGLVTSYRGRAGGFSLARAAETITLADVLTATEGEILLAPCSGAEACARVPTCSVRPVWMKAAELLNDLFCGISIADLARTGADGAWVVPGRSEEPRRSS
jgi:Rrf2 family protein